jgi:hypothetical protein
MVRAKRILLGFALAYGGMLQAQCPNNNVLYNVSATPATCPGTASVGCIYGGEYVLVNVVAGNTYTFSTCGTLWDTQITLYNNTGGAALGYNDDFCGLQSTVIWTATFTGVLRVLVDQYNCASNLSCGGLTVTCAGAPIISDCVYTLTLNDSWGDGWEGSYVGISINGGAFMTYTVPNGSTATYQIGVNIGDVVVVSYYSSGIFENEHTYSLTFNGGLLYSAGPYPATGIVYTNTVTCETPPVGQEDCLGAMTICSNVSLNNNTNHTGAYPDINSSNSGCLDTQEYQGTWYIFSPSAGGDLGLTIQPSGPDDYDWAVWGPYPPGTNPSAICPPQGPPIRCAASSGPATYNNTGSYATGMGHPTFSPPRFASTATSYGIPATTDICPLAPPQRCGWVPGLQVSVGQVFLMYISNWSQSNTGFTLSWMLENGASLDCTVLPLELLDFQAERTDEAVLLSWDTANEIMTDHFVVERANEDNTFAPIGSLPGAGWSITMRHYELLDPHPQPGLNQYRLKQVDTDGSHTYSPIRQVYFSGPSTGLLAMPNPGTDHLEVLHGRVDEGSTIVLTDAVGRIVSTVRATGDRTMLEPSGLPRGYYLLRLVAADGTALAQTPWIKQ